MSALPVEDRIMRNREFMFLLATLVCFASSPQAAEEPKDPDEQFLQESTVATDGPGLLNYLKVRSAGADDMVQLDHLICQLGAACSWRREGAAQRPIEL